MEKLEKVKTSITIDIDIDAWMKEQANRKGMAKSTLMNIAMREYMEATKVFNTVGGMEEMAKIIKKHYGEKIEEWKKR